MPDNSRKRSADDDDDLSGRGSDSNADMARGERPLFETLGLDTGYAPDEEAPPIDRQRIAKFVRRELSPDDQDEVVRLIARYRPWHDAWAELVRAG